MKKLIKLVIVALLFSNCKTIPVTRIELPYKSDPPVISYSKVIEMTADKGLNYDNVMRKFIELHSRKQIMNDDKYNSYFQIKGYSTCKYKKEILGLTYILCFQAEASTCSLTIDRIKIDGVRIETPYFRNKNKTTKKLNPSYEDVNNKINSLMDELVKQIK